MLPRDVANPLLPPIIGVAFITATSPKWLQACQHPSSPSVPTLETQLESPAEAQTERLQPKLGRLSVTTATPLTIKPALVTPATQPTSTQSTGHALGVLPLLHLHLPDLLQTALSLIRSTTVVSKHPGSCNGTYTAF